MYLVRELQFQNLSLVGFYKHFFFQLIVVMNSRRFARNFRGRFQDEETVIAQIGGMR